MTYEINYDAAGNTTSWDLMPSTETAEVLQNVRMILATVAGSVPMDRAFGIDGTLLDEPISRTQARLTAAIAKAVREQEPRARVQQVLFDGSFEDGQLKLTVVVEIVESRLRG